MNIARMYTAPVLVAASFGASGAANAQNYGGNRYDYQVQLGGQNRHAEDDRDARRNDRGDERGYDRRDQSRGNGYDDRSYGYYDRGNGWNRHDRRCHTEWHHHRPVTRCW